MRVAVLGAGLQGTCCALELARRGASIDLYDREPDAMTQASLRNEGKIHHGYVYANDPSMRTAQTMVEGAATFAPLMAEWLGTSTAGLVTSKPFNYAVHRRSLLTPEQVESHLRRTHQLVVDRIPGAEYFGIDVAAGPEALTPGELEHHYDPSNVAAVFRTSEVGIDPEAMASAVRQQVSADHRIDTIYETEVLAVAPEADRVAVTATHDGEVMVRHYDHVINALWDGRLLIDRTAGVSPPKPWLHRVKCYLRLVAPGLDLPSTTIVLGPFGDVVDYGNGCFYLSWYPSGLRGMSSDLKVPEWLRQRLEDAGPEVREGIIEGLRTILPALVGLSAEEREGAQLQGGVIFAFGESDIDDADSGLHHRSAIGPQTHGRYHTIDTGKLTMAPLYAREMGLKLLPSPG